MAYEEIQPMWSKISGADAGRWYGGETRVLAGGRTAPLWINIRVQSYSNSARPARVRGCELTGSWFGVNGRESRNRDVQGVSRRELFLAVS